MSTFTPGIKMSAIKFGSIGSQVNERDACLFTLLSTFDYFCPDYIEGMVYGRVGKIQAGEMTV